MQGWAPGETLGLPAEEQNDARIALSEPLTVTTRSERSGLGMPEPQPKTTQMEPEVTRLSWKEIEKRRRFTEAFGGS
jgi:hypothetical protein